MKRILFVLALAVVSITSFATPVQQFNTKPVDVTIDIRCCTEDSLNCCGPRLP